MQEVTEQDFESVISGDSVLVDFWAPWCGPCRMQTPILEEMQKNVSTKIVKVNTDENQNIARKFKIMGIPTLILFKEGQEVKRWVGVQKATDLMEAVK